MSDKVKEARDRYDYAADQWREVYAEGDIDMLYVAGDPWPQGEKLSRDDKENPRPRFIFDELSQYCNQLINDCRAKKRAIKVDPVGDGADDKTAEIRSNLIRAIEYHGAQAAYVGGFQDAVQRGYGFWRVGKRYVSETSFDQELYISRIANPNTVLIDPDFKEADASDMRWAFVLEDMPIEEFNRRWPEAEEKDFGSEFSRLYPRWVKEKTVQVAEYWCVEETSRKMYLTGDGQEPLYSDSLPEGFKVKKGFLTTPDGQQIEITKERKTTKRKVMKYLTNGVEILESNEWEGKYIPVIPCWGKETWIDTGAGSKRMFLSLVRRVRDAVMLYNYYRSTEAEIIGMSPKNPWVGYEGQTEGHELEWATANRVSYSILLAKPVLDATGTALLPLPQRQPYEPPIQALEMGAESMKRGIQNGLGMYNASVGKQDTAAKSGKAIQALDVQSDQGNFHYTDNFDRAVQHTGRILNDMIPVIYDTQRQVSTRKPDDSHEAITINAPAPDKAGNMQEYRTDRGEHDVTISTGPSYQSQRQEASEFADTLVQSKPELFNIIGDQVVKLKNLGTVGDEISKRLKKMLPPQLQDEADKQGQQSAQQLQQAGQMIDALTKTVNDQAKAIESKQVELQADAQMKQAELASKERIAKLQADTQIEVEHMKLAMQTDIMAVKQDLEILKAHMSASLQSRQQDLTAADAARKAEMQQSQAADQSALQREQMGSQTQLAREQMQSKQSTEQEKIKLAQQAAQQKAAQAQTAQV